MKDHEIRELVNELTKIAREYHSTDQLRERIANSVRNAIASKHSPHVGIALPHNNYAQPQLPRIALPRREFK